MKIDGIECPALTDLGAQMSTITITFAKQLGSPIQQLDQILNIEARVGDSFIFEVHQIKKLPGFKLSTRM